MKNFILIIIFTLFSGFAFGQFYDDCATAGSNVDNIAVFPHNVVGTITTSGNTDDGSYTATSLTDPKKTAFYSFTVNADGYYSISFQASGASPASGTLSVGWDPGSGTCAVVETDADDITDGFDITSDCVDLTNGTTYYISMALEDASEGEFTITISEYGEEECEGYHEEFVEGNNPVDNDCSHSPPANAADAGTVWNTYTIVSEGNDHITVDISTTDGTLSPASIISVYLNDCPANGGTDITGNTTCLSPGDVLYIESGNTTPLFGDYTVVIDQYDNGVANDVCSGAIDFGMIASSCQQVDNAADNTGACPDNYNDGGCDFTGSNMHSIWYTFTTDADAEIMDITTDLTNASFALYTGPDCDNMAYEGGSCSTGGADLTDFPVTPNTTYYLLIGSDTEASFNIGITIKNIPDNDLCVDAEDMLDGLDGTNVCANAEFGGSCSLDANSSHEVYYTYTNNNGANVDLEITISGSTNTTGNAATGVSVLVMTDCIGTLYNNTNTFCSTLDAQFTIECIEDGETIYLLVGSVDGEEGDFGIAVNEVVSTVTNDECTGADPLDYTPCVWDTYTGTNEFACFEDFIAAGCDYNTEPVVWFKFTATADATSVEFDNLITQGTGFMGLFDDTGDCDNPVEADGANGSACISGAGPYGPFDITGGNTYLIAVGSSGGEGDISFDMKVNESPVHDDPCAAGFDPVDLTDGVAYSDDNTCAGPDYTRCNIDNTNGKTLFYEHTMTQDADLEITVNGTTAGGPFTISTYEGIANCGDESNFIQEDCDNNTTTLLCREAGETIVIMIGTSDAAGEFGEYEVTVTENVVARPANDICTDAEDITYLDADLCQWVGADNNETNIDACAEDNDFGTSCDYSHEEVVWYSFTTPPATDPGSQLSIRFTGYDGSGDLFATLFADGNDCTNLTALGACANGSGPNNLGTVDPNTTYLIGVGSTGDDGGNYELEIKITSGPPNDDACADMTDFTLEDGTTLVDQTNACSGAGVSFPECSTADQTNAVFYEFTISAPDYGINIQITATGTNPIQGTVVAGISSADSDFCSGNTYTAPAYCNDISDAEFEWTCLEEGTYQLQISTSDPNSGSFDITSTLIAENVSECNQNDICDDATELVVTEECKWVYFETQCNDDACPDAITLGSCDLSQGPTVWFKVVIPTDAASLDVELDNTEFNDPVMMVLDGCPPGASGVCATSSSNGATLDNPIDVTGQDGNYYYIAVSDPSGGNGGVFELHVKIEVPPINDDPCMADPRPPFDLGTSGSHSGTTCCAVGYNDDPNADLQNQECSGASDDNAVWYRATYDSGYDGVNINITGGTIGNNVAVEVFVGTDDACTGFEFRKSKCDGLPVEDMHIGCLEEGDYVWIKVTSSDGDCGTFDISVEQLEDCDVADACEDVTAGQTLEPVTPDDVEINYLCLSGCLDLACPSDIDGGCDFSQNPTVWYQVNTDEEAAQLYTTVTTSGNWTPIWSVWHPEPDCDNLTNAGNFAGSFPCSSQSTPPDLLIVPVAENDTYYISVTADPNGEPIDDPNFEICVATIKNVVVCLGDDFGCTPDPSLVWEVTGRENTDAEPDGPPYQGPFCPGEELTVHLTFHYDATETGDDWLIGLIPKFGCGWNVDGFDYNANAPYGNGRTADWYTEDGDCPPQIMENVGHLCTYTDADGNLRLVNQFCETIPDGVLCSDGLEKYDTLPSGYFWVMEGGSPDCDPNNCSPSRKYGIGTPVVDITWDFTMTVKEFDNKDDCLDCNDLSIVFQTFSDGVAGCWDDPVAECLIDKHQWSPQWQVNCAISPGVVAEPQPQEICTGQKAGILVYTDDGSQETIEITYEENPNVDGENEHTFDGGTGTIDDVLTLNDPEACAPEIVTYYVQVLKDNVICDNRKDTIYITVYPVPVFEISKTDIAYGEENTGSASVSTSCPDSNFTYLWSTGDTTDMISGLSEGSYIVTVTNIYGCSAIDSVQIITLGACGGAEFIKNDISCFGECTGSAGIENILYGLPPFLYHWSTGDTISFVDSLCEGTYFVTIMDADSCVFLDSISILSSEIYNITTDLIGVKCYGECNGAIVINKVENAVDPVSYLWDNGDTTYYRTNICAGDYYITITDSTGCMYIDTFTITQPDEILIFVDTVIDITSSGAGGIFTHSNNTGNYVFNWTGPEGFYSDKEYIFGLNKAGCYTLTVTDTLSNCTADTTICISDKTGAIDIDDELNIKIYPNPADDVVYFDLDKSTTSKADIRIYNIAGIEINRFEIDQGNVVYKLNTGNITQGLYIVKVLSVNGVEIETFIIDR